MNKMNKKGFTLIEMLVVIAIIAVLVSIIIPIVTSSTAKAQAATNAANLRSIKAEIVTGLLSGTYDETSAEGYRPPASTKLYPAGKTFAVDVDGNTVTVTYDGKTIQDWADLANS